MVIFIGWSHSGKKCAEALKKFLLTCFPTHVNVDISEDISKGENWRSALLDQLVGAEYGIICQTPDSDSAWMCFEAGVLACRYVPTVPMLFNVSTDKVFLPLSSYQAVTLTEKDVRKLTDELYKKSDVEDWKGYETAFQEAWKIFSKSIQEYERSQTYTKKDFERDLTQLGQGTEEFDEWMMQRGFEVVKWLNKDTESLIKKARRVETFMDDLSKYSHTNGQFLVLRQKLENLIL